MDVDCGVQYTLLEECSKSMKEHSTFIEEHSKTQVHACAFCVFRTIWILNGYNLSGQMKRALNSDSKTHVKKQNLTSGTEKDKNR